MVNNVGKLDQSGSAILTSTQLQQSNTKTRLVETTQSDDVTVTNHLSRLINLLGGDDTLEDGARIVATKRLIESGQYHVNVSALADKLLNSGLLTLDE